MKQNSILDILSESATENVDFIIHNDKECRAAQDNLAKAVECLKKTDLAEEQLVLIDNLVAEFGVSSMIERNISYRQGMKNCVSLLQELGIIGQSDT